MANLSAERHAQLDTLRVERVVAAIVGRQIPEPRHYAEPAKAQFAYASTQFTHRFHRRVQIDRSYADESLRSAAHDSRDFIIAHKGALRTVPGTCQPLSDSGGIHRRQRALDRKLAL